MAENKGKEQSNDIDDATIFLQPFITKLGHNLQEIRVRALKTILFKLEHKLICTADLVQERDLLIRLLEWFNYPHAPMKQDVLGLLENLSKHVSAAEILLNMGAVEFFSQLRQDIDPELFQCVDNVTHQLLSIPQSTGHKHSDWCLYRRQDEHVDDSKPVCHDHQLKSSSYPVLSNRQHPPSTLTSQSVPQLGKPKGYFENQKEPPVSAYPCTTHVQSSSMSSASRSHESFSSGGTLTFFQWLPLSSSDRHIMTVTDSRLHNQSSTLVAKSCEFLADVLFKDFPAEIFLQRPSVFKSLLELLEFRSAIDGVCVPLCAIHCLKELCRHVHTRLMATSDPSLLCPDIECWKSHQNILLRSSSSDNDSVVVNQGQKRGSGDGGLGSDATSSSSSDQATSIADDEDDLVTEALQYSQLAVEEMCVVLLPHALEVLRGQLSSNLQVVTSTMQLLFHVAGLIRLVAPDDIWIEGSQANIVMASSVISSVKLLGEVIVHHVQYSGYQGHAVKPDPNLSTHRTTVINLTALLVQLVHVLVPLQQASTIVPTETVTVIWLLSMDGILSKTHPDLHASLLDYLEVLDHSSHQTYLHTREICQSFESTCELLKTTKTKPSSNAVSKLLSLAEDSMPCLAYHKSTNVIKESIKLCSTACSSDISPTIVQTSHRVILRIIAHYDKSIRHQGYKECLGVVKEALRISHVTHPLSTVCHGMLLLLDASVMHQICCYGLYDEDQQVQAVAVDILETLFLGHLSMSAKLWRRLLDAIAPSLPYLEGYIGTHPTLDQSILELVLATCSDSGQITADGQVMVFSPLEQLRGGLRLMFLKDPNVRTQGLTAVVSHLMSDKTNSWGQRLFQSRQSENLRELFIVDQLTSSMNSHVPISHPSIEKVEITKLWSIYSSKNMDWNIRKSAADQLAIILQDPDWHPDLLELKAEEATLEILQEILENDSNTHTPTTPSPSMELVPPCLKILRLLTEYSWSCRHRLASKISVYTTVVMCAVVCRHSVQVNYEAACLLTQLLFDEAAPSHMHKNQRSAFSLPASLIKRYHLPFNPQVYNPVSDYQFPVPQDPDPLKCDPALSMLRVYWNIAWHESLDKLCGVEGIEETASPTNTDKHCKDLVWHEIDSQVVRCSHVQYWLTENLHSISKATSHYPAKLAMTRLHASLLGDLGVAARGSKLVVEKLYTMHWQEALERYLLVLPNSIDDDELLIEVLKILSSMLTSPSQPPMPVVAWIARVTIQSDGPLLSLMRTTVNHTVTGSSKAGTESRRILRKTILQFYGFLVRCLLHSTQPWRFDGERVLVGELAHAVTLNLDLADNPSYYDLPVLESALECLGHVTGRSQWSAYSKSQDGFALCTSMLASLVQVVSAFHAGRLGSSTSFMGKGVTYHASLCLVHLVRELKTIHSTNSWVSHWIQQDDSGSSPLTWLVPLWSDRSPEVRWMGLSIATSLANTIEGHVSLIQALQGVSGGVISTALPLMLDDGECGMVRQQAALLMCCMVANLNVDESVLHGTSRPHSELRSSLPEISTLRALLGHFKFYTHLQSILSSFSTRSVSFKPTSSRACQSSASVSTSSSNIPYQHLQSSSQTASLVSETTHNASQTQSPVSNGMSSPGAQSSITLSNGSAVSSNASVQTQESQTTNSLVPLLNQERGLPSGMSTTSSSTNTYIASAPGSMTSQATTMTSSLTPAFVGALAQLMQTLVAVDPTYTVAAIKQDNILNVFWTHLDSSELQIFLQAQLTSIESCSLSCAAVVVVREVVHMYTCLVQLAHTLARVDHTLLFDLQQNVFTMHKIVGLFGVIASNLGNTLTVHCQSLWLSVCALLVTLLQSQGPVTVSSVTEETIYKHWQSFIEIFKTVLGNSGNPHPLRTVVLKLLGLLLTCEGKRLKLKKKPTQLTNEPRKSRLTELLDNTQRTETEGSFLVKVVRETPRECPSNPSSSKSTGATMCQETKDDRGEQAIGAVSGDTPSGAVLCTSLLGLCDGFGSKLEDSEKREKVLVKVCITALLALSKKAKDIAQNNGLVETTIEHIKHLHVQLNMDSLQLGKGPSWKKKDNPIIGDIISDLDLLENFIHRHHEGKLVCIECNLLDVLHKLWSWCAVEVSLRCAVISLLGTLTAKCPKASTVIAGGSSTSRASQSGSTLLHSLLKSAVFASNKVLGNQICHDLDVQLVTFKSLSGLLSNLVLTAECRGIIWKSNFLQQFSKLKPLKTTQGRPKHIHRVVGVSWLAILVNLTFFTDGQHMVMKIPGCVGILLEFCHVTQGKHATSDVALLVLRNLCFHSNSKSVLLSNDVLISHLISNIDHTSSFTRALAVSALWSLVQNNQKAKVTLKSSGLQRKLEELKMKQDKDMTNPDDKYQTLYTEALEKLTGNMVM